MLRISSFALASFAVLLVAVAVFAAAAADKGHGWGNDIEWRTWDEAKAEAKAKNKPIMLILHKSWCGACKRLRPSFAETEQVQQLAKSFVMVSAEDDEKPHEDPTLAPDGGMRPSSLTCASSHTV
jgi:protein-disulfide reductase (glutathione)